MDTNESLAYELIRFNSYMLSFARSHLGSILSVNGKSNQGELTMQQLNFLLHIETCGKITISDLAKDFMLSKSSTSLSVGQMVRKGYLNRESGEDARFVFLSVSDLGSGILEKTKFEMVEKTSAFLAMGDANQTEELFHHLKAINQIIFSGGQEK